MMLVPIAAIVLLGFAWDIRSYIALTIAVAAIVFALHTAGLFTPIAERFIQLQSLFAAGLQNFIQGRFKRAVAAAVNARYVTAAIAFVALLSAIAVVISGRLPFSFFPPLASDQIVAQLTMPLGTSSEVTDKAILRLERSAQVLKARLNQQYPGDPPVKHIMAAIGDQPSSGNGPATMVASDSGSTAKAHLGEVVMQNVTLHRSFTPPLSGLLNFPATMLVSEAFSRRPAKRGLCRPGRSLICGVMPMDQSPMQLS